MEMKILPLASKKKGAIHSMGAEPNNGSKGKEGTLKSLLNAKTIKFIPGICLLVNALTGPSIPFTPSLFQEAGWFPTVSLFVVFTVLAVVCGLLIVEAMQAIPGNKHFQGTVEFATLVNFYFGHKTHIMAQVCLYGAIQSNAIQSIVLSAQAFDNILVDLFGKTCGVAMRFDSKTFVCVTSGDLSASPFGNQFMLCTIGLAIVLVLALPLGFLDLDNNVELQLAWFVISGFIFLQWIITSVMFTFTDDYIQNPVKLPVAATGIESLPGTIMLSMAFTFVIPSWVNIKKKDVGIEKSLWWSGIITLLMYLVIGIVPALCYPKDPTTGGNILITLSQFGIPLSLTKATVYLFPIIMLLPSIPVSCIVSYDNIAQSDICRKRTSAFLAFVVPWLCSIPLQTGKVLGDFQVWASLLFVSTANFIVPIIIYLKCVKFREAYNRNRSILTSKQRSILKKVHLRSKPILQWVDYLANTMSEENLVSDGLEVKASKDTVNEMQAKVEGIIISNRVVIFSKTYCPYCVRAKALLSENGINFRLIELDEVDDGPDMQSHLAKKTGQITVPSIFINRRHIGGCAELLGMEQRGELALERDPPRPPLPDTQEDSPDDTIAYILREDVPDPIAEDRARRGLENGNNVPDEIEVVLDASTEIEQNRLSTVAFEYKDTTSSSIDFERLEDEVPGFCRTFSLPADPKFRGVTFRSFPRWVTRRVSTRVIALVTMTVISIVCIGNVILLIKGIV